MNNKTPANDGGQEMKRVNLEIRLENETMIETRKLLVTRQQADLVEALLDKISDEP